MDQGCSGERQPPRGFFFFWWEYIPSPLCASVSPLLEKGEGCLLHTLSFSTAAAPELTHPAPSHPRCSDSPLPQGSIAAPSPKQKKPLQVPSQENSLLSPACCPKIPLRGRDPALAGAVPLPITSSPGWQMPLPDRRRRGGSSLPSLLMGKAPQPRPSRCQIPLPTAVCSPA